MNIYHTSKLPGRTVETTDGREFLWFSGTDYLGMGHNEDLRRYTRLSTETFGNHYGSSRNNSLRLDIYEKAEAQLADFLQTPAATIVSSGMWAGQLLMKEVETIVQQNPDITSIIYHNAPGVHPALWGHAFHRTKGEWSDWAMQTVRKINAAEMDTAHIICTDAVGSPMVRAFDFTLFNTIQNPANAWLIIDESHSLGVLGPDGKGVSAQLSENTLVQTVFVSSLNKALGIPAGAIWGAKSVIDTIRNSPWYAGASPPAPAYAYALKKLLEENTYAKQLSLLLDNVAWFGQQLGDIMLFESIADYPVFCSYNAALFDHLLQNGIMASCFPYPSPADAPVTRIAISSLHQKEDLDRLAEVCKRFNA
ncbi:7-keto-8-aminopelargonate synthetase [Dyadobacter sp. SG02]|uniref:aminotransferase class I/II-fold pyridoxal phosphate-dependent enzyme n=1 Tax=Dyadobacter sp. SG02 TaxID=1855291 RepID=UPI0008AC604C|nr:aminotransferase class I/II-fold pyridoxal phosphate-dependent enzyme [Dyadobacter sp. SG02]SEI90313.1 7-keto-8-aminopelargonate synthetase [Dyadobacter sp. SG02]